MLDYFTEMARQRYVSSLQFARIYAHLGETNQVFEQLEKAYYEHDVALHLGRSLPAYDPLRDDPRFQDLLRRMNLEP